MGNIIKGKRKTKVEECNFGASTSPLRATGKNSATVETMRQNPLPNAVPQATEAVADRPQPSQPVVKKKKYNLIKAAKTGAVDDIRHLISEKADINKLGMWNSSALIYACQYCHVDAATVLIKEGNADVQIVNERGATALLLSSMEGLFEVVRLILEKSPHLAQNTAPGIVYNSKTDLNSRLTPIIAACTNGHVEVVKVLIEYKADINAPVRPLSEGFNVSKDENAPKTFTNEEAVATETTGTRPILACAKYGHSEVLKLLLEAGSDLQLVDEAGNSALLLACHQGHTSIFDIILASGGQDTVRAENDAGMTSLHICARFGHHKLCQKLLKLKLIDINRKEKLLEQTPLAIACSQGYKFIVQELVDYGADALVKDKNGDTALDLATLNQFDDIVEILKTSISKMNLETKGQQLQSNANMNSPRPASPV